MSTCDIKVSSQLPDWDAYMLQHSDGGVYHDARWGRVMDGAYGNKPFYLTARRDGDIVGVLQLVEQKSLLFGKHLCSVPYFDAAGFLADDDQTRDALIGEAQRIMADRGDEWVELRHLQPMGDSSPVPLRTDKVTMWLDLPSGSEAMWKQLRTKVRTKVRKAQKSDLPVEQGGGELLDDFFSVYSRTMRDLGSPSHSRRFFRLVVEAFGDSVKLFVVRRGGDILAASFTMADRWGFHVPWSGSDVRFRRMAANRLMYWSMLAHASDTGAKKFDFGRSTRDSGTYGFKKEWGAEEVQLYWYYLLGEGKEMPELRPDSKKFRFMVACWRKLPLPLARFIGPHIISKLS